MKKYILAIDQSTSATKVILFNRQGARLNRVSIPHRQYYPRPGFVEHDPEEIFANVIRGLNEVVEQAGMQPAGIAAISITNQRETALIWDRKTGRPVAPAAVWQCQRGAGFCDYLRKEGLEPVIKEKTGLIIDPYFSASKLQWIMENVEGVRALAENGDLLWGTVDCWLLWKLTAGKVHATDHSNASRTMLYNIKTLEWDRDLMKLCGLHPSMFPEVKFSDQVFGVTDKSILRGAGVPVAGLLGDSHAALFGQHCHEPGMAKATYGTGSSVMMNTGREFMDAPQGLVTSVGFSMNGMVDYVFEGNIHSAGDTIKWLEEGLGLISGPRECEDLAVSAGRNNGVYLVPAFVGLGAPYWDNSARASITGMGRDTTRAHIARAAVESIAYQVKDLVAQMESGGGTRLRELRVDGGAAKNDFLMQFQSDILGRRIIRAGVEELSALGSAFMAGIATGLWEGTRETGVLMGDGRTFEPEMDRQSAETLYSGWKKAVSRTRFKCDD
jgi:glycerol kinase